MPQSNILRVNKQLTISIDLPNSVQRDEILAIPVVIHNHLNRDIIAKVTLHNTEQKFRFAEVSNQVNDTTKSK